MLCDEKDCSAKATHCNSRWVTCGWMTVEYWCVKHAPPDADNFEEEARMTPNE